MVINISRRRRDHIRRRRANHTSAESARVVRAQTLPAVPSGTVRGERFDRGARIAGH